MSEAIFLSASVPDPKRAPEFAKSADAVAISAAVSALVYVTLGRRLLVWGGHPAITPMIWIVAESMGVDYGQWVKLYQSKFFEDEFPEDNERFRNVVYTEAADGGLDESLLNMRQRMFEEQKFSAAVFIGGMRGILDEFNLFRRLQPTARPVPVISTGGATKLLASQLGDFSEDLCADLDYVALFHRHLEISPVERRYFRPDEQPEKMEDRMWKHGEEGRPSDI